MLACDAVDDLHSFWLGRIQRSLLVRLLLCGHRFDFFQPFFASVLFHIPFVEKLLG
jgi:hypothetical protein